MTFASTDLIPFLSHPPFALIDVRSETEFAQSGIDGFLSIPLLYQEERSQVGTTYKHKGQAAAIELGHKLVDPHRPERVQRWGDAILQSERKVGIVMCWRGGLRSQIATQWIREGGFEAEQLVGGYKQLRQHFLDKLDSPPPLLILSGMTGSGKTDLLDEFPRSGLDLEKAANHRGSSFGQTQLPQPKQTQFENRIALGLYKERALLEDESRMLGRLSIPEKLFQAMRRAPTLYLECDLEERVARIYSEYIGEALAHGLDYSSLHRSFQDNLSSLRRRLDRHYTDIKASMDRAFSHPPSLNGHREWIASLLSQYYDKSYEFSMRRFPRRVLFRGDREACRDFLRSEGLC